MISRLSCLYFVFQASERFLSPGVFFLVSFMLRRRSTSSDSSRKKGGKSAGMPPDAATKRVVRTMMRGRSSKSRYVFRMYPDGSERPERVVTGRECYRRKALEDFFGEEPLLPVGANVRGMKSLLAEVMSKLNLREGEFDSAMLAEAWRKAAGEYLAEHAQLISLSDGLAVIAAPHPAVRFELQRQQKRLMTALNGVLGMGCVKRLRFIQH